MFKLKPFQEEALRAVLSQKLNSSHVICVAPTGSGKSLIYEKAAAYPRTRTLLITPLVALARQQYQKLQSLEIPVTLGAGGTGHGPPSCESGVWIISPEILTIASRRNALKTWNPNLLVVDECHCLWEWGEHFRPAFSLIPPLIEETRIPRSLWLTATLPFDARTQLKTSLPQPITEVGGFDLPPQLYLEARKVEWKYRVQAVAETLLNTQGQGMIFSPTRTSTLRIEKLITSLGKKALVYHGGMSSEERINAETLILNKIPDVIIATSAFGMGMDYSHLSYVILWQAPPSLLSLVQIIGRVGRGNTAKGRATVFWDHEDFRLLEWTIGTSTRRKQELLDLLKFLETFNCRRVELKKYFDRTLELRNCNLCDYCTHNSA